MRLFVVAALVFALVGGTAKADAAKVIGFTVATAPLAGPTALPSASLPNAPGSISVPVSFTTAPPTTEQLTVGALAQIWHAAGATYGIPWQTLAAINKIESNFGGNMGPSSAGAIGWMQFMPDTWLRWGVDANGDGVADPWNASDAIYAAARYLAASGGQTDIARAIFSYNHAQWYVNEVQQLAGVFGQGGTTETANLQQLQDTLDAARRDVVDANVTVVAATNRVRAMEVVSNRLQDRIDSAGTLSDQLVAQRQATLYDAGISRARSEVERAQTALHGAQKKLQDVQQNAQAPSFAPGASPLLAGPSYGNGYVFPVGGGPSLVSAAHTHHDYPAVDIAAPEGSPAYALANAVVVNEWHAPDPRCGIGMTIRATDGQVWTYCHLAYLAPNVVDGATLTAGQQIGLVGQTGDASGPHLHLQLQPPTAWPQQEPWFQSFVGRAFRWQDAPTQLVTDGLPPRTLAGTASETGPIITFTH